jgi:DNA invertase Pin-like site-specific DNA recombinase
MARIGYARVSSSNQDLALQRERLTAAGCAVVRAETGSGASRNGRTELATLLQFLRAGDELVVHRLDRLGRSTRDVLNLIHELDACGASLRILEPEITTGGDMGRMVITILGMVADMELKFIKARQRAGIEAAKAKGVYKGRRKTVDDGEIRRRVAHGTPKAQVARDLGISRMTVYRALAANGACQAPPAAAETAANADSAVWRPPWPSPRPPSPRRRPPRPSLNRQPQAIGSAGRTAPPNSVFTGSPNATTGPASGWAMTRFGTTAGAASYSMARSISKRRKAPAGTG